MVEDVRNLAVCMKKSLQACLLQLRTGSLGLHSIRFQCTMATDEELPCLWHRLGVVGELIAKLP